MKKVLMAVVLASAFTASLTVVGAQAPTTAGTVADVSASQNGVSNRGRSMVLSMGDVAKIFLEKFPTAAIHSISLETTHGQYAYKVEGYSLSNTYSVSIDCLSGELLSWQVDEGVKNIAEKIFNPTTVITPLQAQDIAVSVAGEKSLAKGWKVEANKEGIVYSVLVYKNKDKRTVRIDAKTGQVLKKGSWTPVSLLGLYDPNE